VFERFGIRSPYHSHFVDFQEPPVGGLPRSGIASQSLEGARGPTLLRTPTSMGWKMITISMINPPNRTPVNGVCQPG
jgi:hypothetical protein